MSDSLLTYVLPLRASRPLDCPDFDRYLRWVASRAQLVIVDGSAEEVFARHHAAWSGWCSHLPVDPDLRTPMGKVGGVLTGLRRADADQVVLADDDVRYDDASLSRMGELLTKADVVRPQNYFDPLPWHAVWDSGRALINRLLGGDWPGTLGVRRSLVDRAGGYRGDVMFENFELVQAIRRQGGEEVVALDLFVRRLPPTSRHFFSQRVRQAYDEFARPVRMALWLAVLPTVVVQLARSRRAGAWTIGTIIVGATGAAEAGRRRRGARSYFPLRCALAAPLFVGERSLCSWLALGQRLRGGVAYGDTRLRDAATLARRAPALR